MAETDDESESIASPSRPEERRQAALRQTYEERQAALEKQAALIKEQYGAKLEKQVSVAGVEDTEIKALAVDQMARSMAVKGIEPSQISHEDSRRLADQSIEQAYKLHEAQQQRDPMQGVQPHDPKRDYGELQDTHEQVAGQKAATEQQDAPDRVQAFLDAKRQRQADASADRPEAAHEPPQPAEVRTSATTRNADRVEEFLQAKNLDREARKALLQELGRAAGREVSEQQGKEITRDQGGGQSL